MSKILCSNKVCDSHGMNPLFNVSVAVDEDRDLSENINKIDPEYFTCAYCGSASVEEDLDEQK